MGVVALALEAVPASITGHQTERKDVSIVRWRVAAGAGLLLWRLL
jgi:hypothetical protein